MGHNEQEKKFSMGWARDRKKENYFLKTKSEHGSQDGDKAPIPSRALREAVLKNR